MALSLFSSTSISTTSKSATKSRTATGEMADDIYFLLSAHKASQFSTTIDCKAFEDIQPVTCQRVDFETWRTSGRRQEKRMKLHGADRRVAWADLLRWSREKWVGRRINDEVEMFEDGMGEEYTELRKDLERHGLTVRPYITSPEIASTKFPSPTYKAITGEGENTLMARCMRTLRDSVSKTNDGEGIVTGLLADLPGRRAKSLAILRVPDEDMNKETVTFRAPLDENETVMNVVGRIDDGEIKLEVPDEEFKKYFNSLGGFAKTSLVPFIDVRAERERLEKEAAKRKKKEAKKHRRNATASTVAAASLGSETATTMTGDTPSLGGEEMDEEARRANKREKDKKKRKAKAERLRIAAADGKRVAEDVVEMFRRQHHETAEMTKGGDETGKEETPDTNGDISYLSLSNQRPLLWVFTPNDQNESDQTSSDNPNEANQPHDPTQVAAATNDDDDRFSSLSDSSFGSTIDEEDVRRRVEVLQCNSREEFREAMKERQGRNIMVAHPDGGVGLGVELGGGEGRV